MLHYVWSRFPVCVVTVYWALTHSFLSIGYDDDAFVDRYDCIDYGSDIKEWTDDDSMRLSFITFEMFCITEV